MKFTVEQKSTIESIKKAYTRCEPVGKNMWSVEVLKPNHHTYLVSKVSKIEYTIMVNIESREPVYISLINNGNEVEIVSARELKCVRTSDRMLKKYMVIGCLVNGLINSKMIL